MWDRFGLTYFIFGQNVSFAPGWNGAASSFVSSSNGPALPPYSSADRFAPPQFPDLGSLNLPNIHEM